MRVGWLGGGSPVGKTEEMGVGALRLSRRAHFFFVVSHSWLAARVMDLSWMIMERQAASPRGRGRAAVCFTCRLLLFIPRSTTRSPRRDLISMLQRPSDPDSQYL